MPNYEMLAILMSTFVSCWTIWTLSLTVLGAWVWGEGSPADGAPAFKCFLRASSPTPVPPNFLSSGVPRFGSCSPLEPRLTQQITATLLSCLSQEGLPCRPLSLTALRAITPEQRGNGLTKLGPTTSVAPQSIAGTV